MITLCPDVGVEECVVAEEFFYKPNAKAIQIMIENGFAFRNSPKNRRWLKRQKKLGRPFARLSNNRLIELVEKQLAPIARDTARAIVRIYRILDSKEFERAMATYPDEE